MAVKGSAPVQLGVIQDMTTASGYGTESSVVIPEPGEYVYSFRIDPTGRSGSMYIGPLSVKSKKGFLCRTGSLESSVVYSTPYCSR